MCGIVGVYGHSEAANITYLGLHALQHRGQEAAGIVTSDGDKLHLSKQEGLVGDAFGKGLEVTLDFDPQKCLGTGVMLFASVLERFLPNYVSLNSFTQLVARTPDGVLKRWPPRVIM